jgi:hypothetical protein
VKNPFLPKVTEIDEDEIPKDPSNRFLMRGAVTEADKDKDKDEGKKSSKDKKKDRKSRSRSRDRGDKRRSDRDRADRGTEADRGDRSRMREGQRLGRNMHVSMVTGKKIKGRGRVVSLAFSLKGCGFLKQTI